MPKAARMRGLVVIGAIMLGCARQPAYHWERIDGAELNENDARAAAALCEPASARRQILTTRQSEAEPMVELVKPESTTTEEGSAHDTVTFDACLAERGYVRVPDSQE